MFPEDRALCYEILKFHEKADEKPIARFFLPSRSSSLEINEIYAHAFLACRSSTAYLRARGANCKFRIAYFRT